MWWAEGPPRSCTPSQAPWTSWDGRGAGAGPWRLNSACSILTLFSHRPSDSHELCDGEGWRLKREEPQRGSGLPVCPALRKARRAGLHPVLPGVEGDPTLDGTTDNVSGSGTAPRALMLACDLWLRSLWPSLSSLDYLKALCVGTLRLSRV